MEQGKKQRRGSAGVSFGSSAHILDAARYIKNAWENISPITIKNAFIKADLNIALAGELAVPDLCIDVLINKLAAIKINLTIQEFDETLQLDEEKNNDYQNCLVEEINELIEEHQMEIKNNTPLCSSSTLSSTENLSDSKQSGIRINNG